MALPSFLKRCYKFPRSAEDRERYWCSPSRRRHRVWGRAFELSVSYEALLHTKHAAKRLLEFLDAPYQCGAEEDYGEDRVVEEEQNRRRRSERRKDKIIWMSNCTFITVVTNPRSVRNLEDFLDPATASKLYNVEFYCDVKSFLVIQQPSLAAEQAVAMESDTPSSRSVVDTRGMDVLLRLLAKHRDITDMTIQARRPIIANDDGAEFPASLGALQDLVGKAQTKRCIQLQGAGLSQVQWNAVISNCNKNVTVRLDYSEDARRNSFPDTDMLNHRPAKLWFSSMEMASADQRQMLLAFIESTTVLEELCISIETCWKKEFFLLCMNAISRNRSLKTFHFYFVYNDGPQNDLTLEEWEFGFCRAVFSHPTIQTVRLYFSCSGRHIFVPSPEKDDILSQVMSQNTVLCKFDADGVLHNKDTFNRVVGPVVNFNRHQQVVQAIKRETDSTSCYRRKVFAAALLSRRVHRRPAYQYTLLKENFDLLFWKPPPNFGIEHGKCCGSGDRKMAMRQDEMKDMNGSKPKRSRSS